jgi:regulator of cell morphogenesis and NO signaling
MTNVIAYIVRARYLGVMTNANTIGELAVAMPEAIPVLERLGIDYCCHGEQRVQSACSAAGITADELLQLIGTAEKAPEGRTWETEAIGGLIHYIVDTHHVYTRQALQTLQKLAEKVRNAHGANHPELLVVERLVAELAAELIPHMLKEEQVLFPFVEKLERGNAPVPFFGTVQNPIRMMMLEHETAGEKLLELRSLTMDYELPAEACTSYKALFARLIELEADLHQHIHLENNILFPRALDLEGRSPKNALAETIGEHHCSCR